MIKSNREAHGASTSFLALGCVGFIASAIAFPAAAQDAASADEGNATRLKGVVVTDTAIEEGPKVDRVQSPKATAAILDTPQTITVISTQTIRQQNLLTLRDALSTIPGITFGAGEGGGGYGDSINLRGYSASNDITVDGVRDSAQYSRTDPFNLQQIEVYNGANSVYNGSGSVGGTINLVQKTPQATDLTVLEAGVGTDDYYRATVDSNLRVSDMVAVRLNAMYHENDVPRRDVEKYERWGIAPSVTLGIESPTRVTLSYLHQEDDNIPTYGVPYYVYEGGLLPGAPYSGYFGFGNMDRQQITVDQATVAFDHDFSDALSIRNLSRWQRVDQDVTVNPPQGSYCLANGFLPQTAFGVPGAACATPGLYAPSGPRGTTRFSENQLMYNQTDLKAVFNTGGLEHTFVIGASITKEDYDLTQGNVQRFADGTAPAYDPISIADPQGVYTGPVNFIASSIQAGSLTNKAVYAFDTIKLGEQFELNGGLRYENNKGSFRSENLTSGVTQFSDNDENLFSYRAGAVFKPTPASSIYVSYANSETPALATVRLGCVSNSGSFCDTAPEKAVNYEIGAKLELMEGALLLTAAAFRNERTNYRVTSNDVLQPTEQVLDGRARVDGIALGATGHVTPAWTVFANYTYLDSETRQGISDYCVANPGVGDCPVEDILKGRPLNSTPKHSGSLFTAYTLPFGLQVGYGFTYQGSMVVRNDVTAGPLPKSDDYFVHRAMLSYPFGNGMTVQLNVQNFTNEKYFTNVRNTTNGWAVPGEGRSARLSLFYSF